MPGIKYKIARHAKNQENTDHNEEEKKKTVTINWAKYDAYSRASRQGHANMFKKVDKSMCLLSRDMKDTLEKVKLNFWKTEITQYLGWRLSHEFSPTADFSLWRGCMINSRGWCQPQCRPMVETCFAVLLALLGQLPLPSPQQVLQAFQSPPSLSSLSLNDVRAASQRKPKPSDRTSCIPPFFWPPDTTRPTKSTPSRCLRPWSTHHPLSSIFQALSQFQHFPLSL